MSQTTIDGISRPNSRTRPQSARRHKDNSPPSSPLMDPLTSIEDIKAAAAEVSQASVSPEVESNLLEIQTPEDTSTIAQASVQPFSAQGCTDTKR